MTGVDKTFKSGMDVLLEDHPDWLAGSRVGLVSHTAAVDQAGITSAEKLRHCPGVNLCALFGPEHGFRGLAAAGDPTQDESHSEWNIPIYSLYGTTRKPTREMLQGVDILVVEFQDLGARPYTYVSTLSLVLEAANEFHIPVIIADRPVPLPLSADGPVTDNKFKSFVAALPLPMQYGMTPAETALWIQNQFLPELDLRIAPMQGYNGESERQRSWPPWMPPSPRIKSWESASLFTCTVFGEALPALDYGSGTNLAFQLVGAPWLERDRLADRLSASSLTGIRFEPIDYQSQSGLYQGMSFAGLRLIITDYTTFRPLVTCITLIENIITLYGHAPLWTAPGTRPGWFDSLFGTDQVRLALQADTPAAEIIAQWQPALIEYRHTRRPHLLYGTR
ncbi:MAG: DUF1343 domain-containing protein [bacterium]|jgi:uncharacterized protein YbbC (DUF1343 family)